MRLLIFITSFDNACWIFKLKTIHMQSFLFSGRTYLLIDSHTSIRARDWNVTGFRRTRAAPKPGLSFSAEDSYHTARQVSARNLGNLMNTAWYEKSLAQGDTWTESKYLGTIYRAKAVPRCMLTIRWHRGSQVTAWTFNWSLASCWRNSPSVTVSHLTVSLHRSGYSLNFCG